MATRPAFYADGKSGTVRCKEVTFKWFPGFSTQQKRRSIDAMHGALRPHTSLEVSTKSSIPLGESLSAFRLMLKGYPLECVFQASKVYSLNGPFPEFLKLSPKEAKCHRYHDLSGNLTHFRNILNGVKWPLEPKTVFYDYLYLEALKARFSYDMLYPLRLYHYFTDIEFNPKKSINCQARSVALAKLLLHKFQEIPEMSVKEFISLHKLVVKG